jgi:hypothetical protein
MRNGTFCMLHFENKDTCQKLNTDEIPLWRSSPWPGTSFTQIAFGCLPNCCGFECGLAVHRNAIICTGINKRWIWHGNVISRIIEETSFPVYYKKRKKLLIARCDEDSTCDAFKRLCPKQKNKLNDCQFCLDLLAIKDEITSSHRPNAQIKRLWIRTPHGRRVKIRALYGKDLTAGGRLSTLLRRGEIVSLAAFWPTRSTNVDVTISNRGVVTFVSDHDLEECLVFLEGLARKYLCKNRNYKVLSLP